MCLLYILGLFLFSSSAGANTFNPDVYLSTSKLAARHGYRAESHEVVTSDGFILTVHRILKAGSPTRQRREPVLFQHGVLESSAGWLISGPNRSLAFRLADLDYDVWLGNVRGNMYSRAHVSLSPSDPKFWDFSWHEMAVADLAAMVDHVLEVSGHQRLVVVGHSMGTTLALVLLSSRPEFNSKVRLFVALAPVAFLSRARSPLRYLAPYAKNIELIASWFGPGEFLPRNTLMDYVLKMSCENSVFESKLCEHYIFIICGHDPQQFDMKLLPEILGHSPAGTSTKTLVHFAQEIESARFRQFDYGEEMNLKVYGSRQPPQYNLSAISAPVALFYADNDLLANPMDVALLEDLLPNPLGMFRINFSLFNHLDFLWSLDVDRLVNLQVEKLITADRLPTPLPRVSFFSRKYPVQSSW